MSNINDINIYLNIVWMLTTASIALGIINVVNSIWSDLFN
jgi:hypothetical protein